VAGVATTTVAPRAQRAGIGSAPSPGTSKLAGDHVGRDAALATLGAYAAAVEGTLQAQLHDVMANDEHVAGWATDTASAGGRSLEVSAVVIFSMQDGKVVKASHHFDDPAAVDAFLTYELFRQSDS